MAIPDFQSVMLPVLKFLADENEHMIRDVVGFLAEALALTPEELAETLEKSGQSRFASRVQWAVTYLVQAGLIQRTGRARIRITQRGLEAIQDAAGGSRINMKYLERFEEYRDFAGRAGTRTRRSTPVVLAADAVSGVATDPSELLEASYGSHRTAIANDLLTRIKSVSPRFFEGLVLDLLVARATEDRGTMPLRP